jgi:hypothetical protein
MGAFWPTTLQLQTELIYGFNSISMSRVGLNGFSLRSIATGLKKMISIACLAMAHRMYSYLEEKYNDGDRIFSIT